MGFRPGRGSPFFLHSPEAPTRPIERQTTSMLAACGLGWIDRFGDTGQGWGNGSMRAQVGRGGPLVRAVGVERVATPAAARSPPAAHIGKN